MFFAFFLSGALAHNFSQKQNVYNASDFKLKDQQDQYNPLDKFEQFSHELYQQALEQKQDVIIFVEPEKYRDSFQKEIADLLTKIQAVREMQKKKRKLKVFLLKEVNQEIVEQFSDKYYTDINEDTILLLKNKYITSFYNFSPQDYFENKEQLLKYFTKIYKLSQKNFDQMRSVLKYLPANDTIILIYNNKSHKDYKNVMRRLSIVQNQQNYSKNPQIHWMVIDDYVAQQIKINNPVQGQMYFLLKSSKFNDYKKNLEYDNKSYYITEAASLAEKKIDNVIEQNSIRYNNANIFTAQSFEIDNPKYSIVLEIDNNRISQSQRKELIQIFGKFHNKMKEVDSELEKKVLFVNVNKHSEKYGQNFKIYIRNDAKIFDRIVSHSINTREQLEQLSILNEMNEGHTYQYNFPKEEAVTVDNLLKFWTNTKENNQEESFISQKVPKYRKYSQKLVGKSFQKEVLDSDKTYAVFQYSKRCHACKQYGGHFEDLALDSLKDKDSKVLFGRLNNDRNQLSCSQNLGYTPVFQIFKKGIKDKPYMYRHQIFTPELLKQFIRLTNEFEVVQESDFQNIQNEFKNVMLNV